MGAYDGYKYAKKKGYKGWKMYASIAGGAALGTVNPFKIFKMAKSGYKAYKAVKYTKKARNVYKKTKRVVKVKAKPKATVVAKKQVKSKAKVSKAKKSTRVVKKQTKSVSKRTACFTAGTKIHTKDGFKEIETIKAGDYVWSENPETHEKALKKVKKIFVREKDSVVRLSINGEAIETTNEHPFYVEGHGWTNASDLKAGDKVRLEDGTAGTVEKAKHVALNSPVTVYNFEVEDFHTYYVSEQKVLVHNTCAATAKNTLYLPNETVALDTGKKANYVGKVKSGNGQPPANFSPEGAGRRGAFREAKRASGIPVTAQPKEVRPAVGKQGQQIPGRDYVFENPQKGGDDVIIREHFGHKYPDNPSQNRGNHFNDIHGNHYDYD